MHSNLLGLIYTGRIGRSPFDPSLWSSTSARLFGAMKRRGVLSDAIGIELPRWQKYLHMLQSFARRRSTWRTRLLSSVDYREELTESLSPIVKNLSQSVGVLQIGAMFNSRRMVPNCCSCYSYNDGNFVERLNSPLPKPAISTKNIDRLVDFERQVSADMDYVFTFSEYLRQSFIDNYQMPADRVIALGSGINLDSLPRPHENKRYDTEEILFIGVDFERKGGKYLLRSFRTTRQKFPQAKLHIVGPKQWKIDPDFANGVCLHGFLDKRISREAQKLQELFECCSLFVMPSLYEPFGIAPLEAMAYGIPALVTNQWALKEIVRPGITGEHVELASEDSLTEMLCRMLAEPESLARMGANARNEVIGKYSWDAVVDRLILIDSQNRSVCKKNDCKLESIR